MKKYITKNSKETQELGEKLATSLFRVIPATSLAKSRREAGIHVRKKRGFRVKPGMTSGAVVLALRGNLGGGKTTFLQGFAKGLGIKEKILSPTFVIMKKFKIKDCPQKSERSKKWGQFFHFDCYRITSSKDILELGFEEIISDPKNIIAIEWPEKIAEILPENVIEINFKFLDESKREISVLK